MRSYVVVVICVGAQYSAKMGLAEDNDVVQAFPANRPNQSFGKPVLPRRTRCDGFVPNTLGELLVGAGRETPSELHRIALVEAGAAEGAALSRGS